MWKKLKENSKSNTKPLKKHNMSFVLPQRPQLITDWKIPSTSWIQRNNNSTSFQPTSSTQVLFVCSMHLNWMRFVTPHFFLLLSFGFSPWHLPYKKAFIFSHEIYLFDRKHRFHINFRSIASKSLCTFYGKRKKKEEIA